MTEFKITPEDVGRVAVDDAKFEWSLVAVSHRAAAWESAGAYHVTDLEGVGQHPGTCCMRHWKPRTLVAPKRWWNVHRTLGDVHAADWDSYEMAAKVEHESLIARIYAEHWHGCEEGRFDTPESIGAPS